jgi:hypothetical protein
MEEINISACLITKDNVYPQEVLSNVSHYPFGEILILTHSDSPFRKYELFNKAKFDTIYYQDDDALVPINKVLEFSQPNIINVPMKEGHYRAYAGSRMTMGLGWGSIFPKEILKSLEKYTHVYGEDEVFKRETERILTYLNYPQNRFIAEIIDLPSAYAPDRLWRQPEHNEFAQIVEERCRSLVV